MQAPPLYIQEKIHPKAIIDDLTRQARSRRDAASVEPDLFADFNGLGEADKTEFYRHEQNWQNRMILGDSLQVMASLAQREGLRGKVQCVYLDPPYGIRFNSNWQVSTRSRTVKDGKPEHVTREPEQVKAFRDTWKHGIHSYLSYLRDRLTVARDLLSESGSIFVQIGDENVHRVRVLMDEVFGEENFVREIFFTKTGSLPSRFIGRTGDRILWYARNSDLCKFRPLFDEKNHDNFYRYVENSDLSCRELDENEKNLCPSEIRGRIFRYVSLESGGQANIDTPFEFCGKMYQPNKNSHWTLAYPDGMSRLSRTGRIVIQGNKLRYRLYIDDYPVKRLGDVWADAAGFSAGQVYVVETRPKVIQRCLLMSTDPGDLVLDPTCGAGTTARVAEQWGRRWITIDTSRVALALARARLMGARYPYYLLADSPEGRQKQAALTGAVPEPERSYGNIRQGFVYERVPHITLKSIANNTEIDVLWEKYQKTLEPLRQRLNAALGTRWEEWEIPRSLENNAPGKQACRPPRAPGALPPETVSPAGAEAAEQAHRDWWAARIARQKAIEASIAARADFETLYDKPYTDPSRVRVSGPFTVESLSPHRMVSAEEEHSYAPEKKTDKEGVSEAVPLNDFTQMVLENMKSAGVHQIAKENRITFSTLEGWPGQYIAAVGHYTEGDIERRAGLFIGPEYGTVTCSDLANAAGEAQQDRFDTLIACGFNFDAHTSELTRLGPLPILKARMNPDLHMSKELKNTGAGNLFVVFGEPDIEWDFNDEGNIVVEVLGVDVFDPKTGTVRASGKDDIAAWFIDTNYNRESFFVRHAYFMGANDPYKALKTSLKAEIDKEAWATLYRDTSRPFMRPQSGRFAVKVINHFGDEVMKVFDVS